MNANVGLIFQGKALSAGTVPAWLLLGVGVYVFLLVIGSGLLGDSDTYWQIATGQWILDHATLPLVDIYSFTRAGEPWISSSWLAQVLYAASYHLAGWTGPVVLAASTIAATFALLTYILGRRIPSTYAILIALAAVVLSGVHFYARPHVLALPVMVAWANGLMEASERREAPSWWLLPLISLWANLHGGFVFGLVLVGAFALDAVWNAEPSQRRPLAVRWFAFGVGAVAACCVTPYGWGSILAARKILDLGELLHLISEWMPADFSSLGPFELSMLALIGSGLYCGVVLSPPRIALVLGLLHMALSHVRNVEIFALLLPIVMLTPVSSQFALRPGWPGRAAVPVASTVMLVAMLAVATWAIATNSPYSPPTHQSPAAAVDALKARHPKRVLHEQGFGGYLIWRQVPVFVDGRAELYGEQFVLEFGRAVRLTDVNQLLDLLKNYEIDAVLLRPSTPAAKLLDHLGGWQRVYADELAVLHVRSGT